MGSEIKLRMALYGLVLKCNFSNLITSASVSMARWHEYPNALGLIRKDSAKNMIIKPTILDIGTGGSFFPLFAAVHKFNVWATDISKGIDFQKEILRDKRAQDFIYTDRIILQRVDARHLPYTDNSFDYVTCISTVEHIPPNGDVEATNEFVRVVKPGGLIILTFACGNRYREATAPYAGFLNSRIYTKQKIIERLAPSGTKVEKFSIFHFKYDETRKFLKYILSTPPGRFLGWLNPIASLLYAEELPDELDYKKSLQNIGGFLTLRKVKKRH